MASNERENSQLSDVIITGIQTLLNRRNSGTWAGTMTELNDSLTKVLGRKIPENWPASASALRVVLNKTVNRLRVRKVAVRFSRSNDHMRTRNVKLVTR